MPITTPADINSELIRIWNSVMQNPPENPFLSPVFFANNFMPKNCRLLIIGVNPSYSYDGWRNIITKYSTQFNNYTPGLQSVINSLNTNNFETNIDNYFSFNNPINPSVLNEIIRLEGTATGNHDYFKKMHALVGYVYGGNISPWLHLDLFFYRKTNQNVLRKLIQNNPAFFEKQSNLAKEIIDWLEPDIILVANAFAGKIFSEIFRNEFNFKTSDFFNEISINNLTGAYDLQLPGGKESKVFFSGMLSGQHALDLGTYERLKWQIKAVKEGKTMK